MEADLRALQLCELNILKEIKRVCEKHGITYYLSSGTLLGAVRHHGFIPWDDDIDIEMPYPDYCRFLEVAQTELGPDFFVQNYNTEESFHALFTKVMKNGTTMYGEWDVGLPGHHGVWVDVFPLIFIGGHIDLSIKRLCVRISNFITMGQERFDKNREWLKSRSNSFVFAGVVLMRKLPYSIRKKVRLLLSKVIFCEKRKARMALVWQSITYVHSASVFAGEPKQLCFEDAMFSCPTEPEEYLRNAYGDYMTLPPEEKRNGGHGHIIVDLEHGWDETMGI